MAMKILNMYSGLPGNVHEFSIRLTKMFVCVALIKERTIPNSNSECEFLEEEKTRS